MQAPTLAALQHHRALDVAYGVREQQKSVRLKTIIPLPKEPLVKTGFPASILMLLMLGIIAFLPPY